MIVWIVIVILVIAVIWQLTRSARHTLIDSTDQQGHDKIAQDEAHITCPLVYNGNELEFSDEVLNAVLTKHFSYYNRLLDIDREKFISRLRKFIGTKIFIIHDKKGYREMPILISAAAIQLTFGLRKYLLSHFNIIQIFPEAFVGLEPFRILIGNVTGNTINIAWKQFLEGYKNKYDLQNVGLHDMAHAMYYQNFETELSIDRDFKDSFSKFNSIGDKIYHVEKILTIGLYSEYAIKDFQEFWAESIEIYFKSPDRLQLHYPELYTVLCDLLNQDPLNYPNHFFEKV
jgi:Mlc titration factor MtfA (ptsG expression regulator)